MNPLTADPISRTPSATTAPLSGAPMDTPRELKVRLPTRLHLMLHIAKVRSGRSIAELLAVAVQEYFERNPELAQVPNQD